MMSDMNILGINISSAELISGIKTLLAIKDYIQTLKDRFDYNVVRMAMNNPISKDDLSSLSESISKAEDKVTELEKNIAFYKGQLSMAETLSKRPSSCTDDTCPFVANSLKIMSMGYDEKLTSSEEELYETEVFIGRANDDLDAMVRLSDCRFILDSITDKIDSTKTILMKLPNGEIFSDSNVLISRFLDGYAFEEINTLASYIDMANVVDLYNNDTKYLSNLEKDLNEFKYKTQMIDSIIEELTELQSGFDSIINQIEALNADITNGTRELMSLKEEDKNYTLLEQSLTELDDISKNKAELTVEYNKIENDIVRIKSLLANLQLNRSRLSVLDNDLKPLVIDRDNCNHSIRTLAEYNEELKQYQANYDTIEAIKYYSSPTSGIQIIFLNLYMNKILSLANELLSLMFNGELEILPFIINEREFRIPCCSAGGLPSDDITSMSNSQICIISMAIQFALLYHSSTKLNIPRLDEIDSGLDFSNRGQFIIFLRELMGKLQIQQTFIISHNSEIPTNNVDIIMLKNDNSIKELAGNIIYRY
jgi:DNA repair exonuclease SbcCD ATPase subunit